MFESRDNSDDIPVGTQEDRDKAIDLQFNVTIVFLLEIIDGKPNAADDADEVKFFNLNKLPDLSFDHDIIIEDVVRRIKNNVLF